MITFQPIDKNQILLLISICLYVLFITYQQNDFIKKSPKTIGSKLYLTTSLIGFLFVFFLLTGFCYFQGQISLAIIVFLCFHTAMFGWMIWNHLKNRDKTK